MTARIVPSIAASRIRKVAGLAVLAIIIGTVVVHAANDTGTQVATPRPAQAAPATVAKPMAKRSTSSAKPYWNNLNAAQQAALAPLQPEWNKLDGFRKEKWLELANKYQKMPPEEQARIQERMRDWVRLSPEQRRTARQNYRRVKKLPPEQRSAQWEQYQQLPDEKKKQLAASASTKRQIVNPPLLHNKATQIKSLRPVPAKQPIPTPEGIAPSPPAPPQVQAAPAPPAPVTPGAPDYP